MKTNYPATTQLFKMSGKYSRYMRQYFDGRRTIKNQEKAREKAEAILNSMSIVIVESNYELSV